MPAQPPVDSGATIERLIREDWGRILAALARGLGDLQLAEDSLQDAVETAMLHWRRNGLPRAPDAWLLTTARRRAIDQIRRRANLAAKLPDLAYLSALEAADAADAAAPDGVAGPVPDKRLEMMFTCCHPALEEKTRIALTLRTLGGLTTEEIAAAFLDKPSAMGQRLTRAKTKIAKAGIPYKIPEPEDLGERLDGVMRVIYLIFNEGYRANAGDALTRVELSDEAIRLARIMIGLLPKEAELRGLLALLLLHDARRHTREDRSGGFVPLEHQDRKRWDRGRIGEGRRALIGLPLNGPYQIQAAISAQHVAAAAWTDTDWPAISRLYAQLEQREPNPVVRINRAVALTYAGDLAAASALLGKVAGAGGIETYQPFYVARSLLWRRQGNRAKAIADLDRAIELTRSPPERRFLIAKRTDLLRD